MIVEGGLITVPIPDQPIRSSTTIGVGTATAPFIINATTPATLQIFVFGSTSHDAQLHAGDRHQPGDRHCQWRRLPERDAGQQDPNTGNYNPNGIPDAIITINPRSALNLPNGVDTSRSPGRRWPRSPLPDMTWTGTATVTVTGGSVTPIISGIAGVPTGPVLETTFVPTFGANQYTPSLTALSAQLPADPALGRPRAVPAAPGLPPADLLVQPPRQDRRPFLDQPRPEQGRGPAASTR